MERAERTPAPDGSARGDPAWTTNIRATQAPATEPDAAKHEELRADELAAVTAEMLKVVGSGVGVAFALIGYAYSHGYFRGLGMAISDARLSYLDLFHRGTILLANAYVMGGLVLFVLSALAVSDLRLRRRLSLRGLHRAAAMLAFGLVFVAVVGGIKLGELHARAVWWGGAGKPVFCALNQASESEAADEASDPEVANLATTIQTIALESGLRLVHLSDEFHFLAPVLRSDMADGANAVGEVYVIPNHLVQYCRVLSADLGDVEPGAGDADAG